MSKNTQQRLEELSKERFLKMEESILDAKNRRELSKNIWFMASCEYLAPESRLESIISFISKFKEFGDVSEVGVEERMSKLTMSDYFYLESDAEDASTISARYAKETLKILGIASNDNLTPEDRVSKIENLTSPF